MECEGLEPFFQDEGRGALDVLAYVDCDVEDVSMVGSLELEGDYVGRRLTTNYSVPGNIHKPQFSEFWNSLECSELVRDTIRHGYQLPFKEIPPDCFEKNNKFVPV